MNNKNIIYVFISGRKQKLKLPPTEYAKEFFYGYQHFEKTEHNVDIIELLSVLSLYKIMGLHAC